VKRDRRSPRFDATDSLLDAKPVAVLDLHGYSASEAVEVVRGFLATWASRAHGGVVHVITGKGRGSGGRPVLKPKVATLLRTELRHLVADWDRDADDAGYVVRLR
jgi:DNA-nicking Smr family endonuclease